MTNQKNITLITLVGILAIIVGGAWAQDSTDTKPFNFQEASRNVPKPRELYPLVKQDMVPMDLKILSDEIVTSDVDPSKKLRKITAFFYSLELEDKKWGHPCTILTPADNSINETPQRKGKVAIISAPDKVMYPPHVAKYCEPITVRTGYPTMTLISPGVYDDGRTIEGDIAVLTRMRQKTGHNYYNMNCQLAVVYIQAMNVMEKVLGVDRVSAVLGGHSKRGRSATVAAAMDDRVASPIIMGNEGVNRIDEVQWHLSFHHNFFQDQVHVPVFYLGATNEGGYNMFNVNILQQRLKRPMTVEMIPNYRHFNFHEVQFIDTMMWVSHIFDGRPISKVTETSHEYRDGRNFYRAKIESDAKVQIVRVWFVYASNPQWRDLMWFEWLMWKNGDYYETSVPGAPVDAYMIEVADTALGVPGYITSLPIKVSDTPVLDRKASEAGWQGPRKTDK